MNFEKIDSLHSELANHRLFNLIKTEKDLQVFMSHHAYCVWDFMSLLKSLQRKVTCVQVPWVPSAHGDSLVRLINEIVLDEESDVDLAGRPVSHYALYLQAMKEVGADCSQLEAFVDSLNLDLLPKEIKRFVTFNLSIAMEGGLEEVLAVFLYGREALIPSLFRPAVAALEVRKIACPTLIYYFERHIELDGDKHAPFAKKCLEELCADKPKKLARVLELSYQALLLRKELWDNIAVKIENRLRPEL